MIERAAIHGVEKAAIHGDSSIFMPRTLAQPIEVSCAGLISSA
jgi:hypothetical protein